MQQDHTNYPVMLLGSSKDVKRRWSAVAKLAWRSAEIGGAISQLEMIDSDVNCDIYVESSCRLPPDNLVVWRAYFVGRQLLDIALNETDLNAAERSDRLITLLLSSMEHLWFVTGLLDPAFYFPPHWGGIARDGIAYEYFSRFIFWLPTMTHMSGRFRGSLSWMRVFSAPIFWQLNIVRLGYELGYEVHPDVVNNKYGGNLLRAYLEMGIVRYEEGVLRVRDRPN